MILIFITYVQRDVKDFYNIEDEICSYNFWVAVAARTGQLLNCSDLSRNAHIDIRTAKLWLEILKRSGLIHLLYPYNSNVTSKIIKAPKVYFWIRSLPLIYALETRPAETFVFGEILKSYYNNAGDIKNFKLLEKFKKRIGTGAVICLVDKKCPFAKEDAVMTPALRI